MSVVLLTDRVWPDDGIERQIIENAGLSRMSVGLGAIDVAAATARGGSVRSTQRLAEYNQLSRIEEDGLPFARWARGR